MNAFFYNPNIHPLPEYRKRLDELEGYAASTGFQMLFGDYDVREWVSLVKSQRFKGERSERCRRCIHLRLEKSFKKAMDLSIPMVGTTLTVSPHKDAEMINSIGRELSGLYGIEFLAADFKKNDGYRKSVEISRQHGFYRQNYCGCVYSLNPRYY